MNAQIAHDFFDAIIREIAVATVQLQALVGDARSGFGAKLFGHGTKDRCVAHLGVEFPRGLAQESAGRLQINFHIGKAKLQGLELIDRLAKGVTFGHIVYCFVERGLRGPDGARGNIQPPPVETFHGVLETLINVAQ